MTGEADVMDSLTTWAWVDRTGAGKRMAFLLLVHPDPVVGQRLARALRLADPRKRAPEIAERIAVVEDKCVALRLDRSHRLMEIPVGEDWSRFVDAGGPAAVLVGFAPLPGGTAVEELDRYILDAITTSRLLMGVTYHP